MKKLEERVFLYHFTDADKLRRIKDVLEQMKIKAAEIPDEMAGQKVGFLVGLKGFGQNQHSDSGEAFEREVMILQGIDRKRMDEILKSFAAAGIEKIDYKAVVTPYNIFWSLRRLCETMQKEHGALVR